MGAGPPYLLIARVGITLHVRRYGVARLPSCRNTGAGGPKTILFHVV